MVTAKTLNFELSIEEVERVNPMIQKAKSRVMYTGKNRNYSFISKEAVENALHSLKNTPVIGQFISEEEVFGGHGVSLELKDGELITKMNTVPYGVVGENFTYEWEEVVEEDGTVSEYLVVDGIYLWTGRYEELNVFSEKSMSQSMEISVGNSHLKNIDGEDYLVIEDFIFTGLCILGTEEPAFESANISMFSIEKDWQAKFSEMMSELKFSLEKGGVQMSEIEKDYEKTVVDEEELKKVFEEEGSTEGEPELGETEAVTEESGGEPQDTGDGETENPVVLNEGFEEPEPEPEPEVDKSELEGLIDSSEYNSDDYTTESYEEYEQALSNANDVLGNVDATQEDVNNALQALQNAVNGLEQKPVEPEKITEETDDDSSTPNTQKRKEIAGFSLTRNQMFTKILDTLTKEQLYDEHGHRCSRYWLIDFNDTHVFYDDRKEGQQTYQAEYTVDGDDISINMTEAIKVKVEYVPYDGEVKTYSEELDSVKQAYTEQFEILSNAQKELEELKQYKRSREEEDLKEQFSGKLPKDVIEHIFSEMKDSSMQDIEKEIFAEIGKLNVLNFNLETKNTNKIELPVKDTTKNESPFSALEVYLNKQ